MNAKNTRRSVINFYKLRTSIETMKRDFCIIELNI